VCVCVCVCMCVCVCVKSPLGAVAPAGQGCPPASWQSSGSHGNGVRDAPTPDLVCSPPPGELKERERARGRERERGGE